MQLTLEEEFEQYKAVHKYSVLKAKIMDYYATLEQGQVNLPDFLRDDTPEKLANRDLKELMSLNDGGVKFNSLYENAWNEIAEVLE